MIILIIFKTNLYKLNLNYLKQKDLNIQDNNLNTNSLKQKDLNIQYNNLNTKILIIKKLLKIRDPLQILIQEILE